MQELYAKLLAHDAQRLRGFNHEGPLRGYLRRVVVNLCADLKRHEHGHLRLPVAVAGLSPLSRAAYELVFQKDHPPEQAAQALQVRHPERAWAEITAAVKEAVSIGDKVEAQRPLRPRLVAQIHDEQALNAPSEDMSPLDLLIGTETVLTELRLGEQMREALLALPPEQRQAVELRFLHELKPRDIAARLGCDVAIVHGRLQAGLRRLKTALK